MLPRSRSAFICRGLLAACLFLAFLMLNACGSALENVAGPNSQTANSARPPVLEGSAGEGNGIGGTGDIAGEGNGIGGTGTYAGSPGIGGTGIIGTITAFGSIFVNGYEIDYAPALSIEHKDGRRGVDALRVGQVVAVEAEGEGSRLRARAIALRHEVAGPIQAVDRANRSITVLGQRVSLGATAKDALAIDQLRPGQHVDISGARRADSVIVASRIDRSAPGALALVRGRATALNAQGFSVGGLRVASPIGQRPRGLAAGREVVISGTPGNDVLRARTITLAPPTPFRGRVSRLSIEGYARANRDGTTTIGGVPLRRLPGAGQAAGNERVIMEGTLDRQGRFQLIRIRPRELRLRSPRRGTLNRRPAARPATRPSPRALSRPAPARDRSRLLRPAPPQRVWRPPPRWRDRPLPRRRQRR